MLNVLIVDDDASLVQLFEVLLERHGCKVATSQSGAAALSQAQEFNPDVLLCDLHLEHADGLQLLTQLRKLIPHCRMILMTGADVSDLPPDAEASFEMLQKPVGARELLETLGLNPKRAANE
jgi:DNA-binding NtrC family response regulator